MTRLTLHEPVRSPRSVGRTLCPLSRYTYPENPGSNLKHPRTKLWPVEDIAEVAVHSLQVADQGGKPLPSSSFPLPRVGLGT